MDRDLAHQKKLFESKLIKNPFQNPALYGEPPPPSSDMNHDKDHKEHTSPRFGQDKIKNAFKVFQQSFVKKPVVTNPHQI